MTRWRMVAVATALALSACSRGPSATSIDKTFVADMAPHHALGVRMADLALAQAEDVRVREFGFTMGRYQKTEFDHLNHLATVWKATPSSHIHGMLTADEEKALAALSGAEFDRAWLTEMIRHHEGAVTMAATEADAGTNAEAKAIAASVVEVQTKEITKMKATLASLEPAR